MTVRIVIHDDDRSRRIFLRCPFAQILAGHGREMGDHCGKIDDVEHDIGNIDA